MTVSAQAQTFLNRNTSTLPSYTAPPSLKQLPAAPRTLIISCADPRCVPESIFSLTPSDATVVVRVQGADVQTASPALFAIDHLLGFTDLIVLKHTDCGSTMFRDENIRAQLKERAHEHGAEVDGMRFGENTIPIEDSVRRDVKLLRESPFVSEKIKGNVMGMLFHVETGKVEIIE